MLPESRTWLGVARGEGLVPAAFALGGFCMNVFLSLARMCLVIAIVVGGSG